MTTPFVATPSWLRSPAPEAADAAGVGASDAAGVGASAAGLRGAATPDDAGPAALVPDSPGTDATAVPDGAALAARVSSGGMPDLSLLGPLAPFAAAGPVTDLFVNGDRGLWIDRGSGAEREPAWTADEAEVRALAIRLIARGGRHIDEATPAVDVRLGGGVRVHAVLPPVSTRGTVISVRVPRVAGFPLRALAAAGMLDAAQEAMLRDAVARRRNLLVTGAAGAGKTTLLAALLSEADRRDRIVLI
jgi:pilus assembly protein CpaF